MTGILLRNLRHEAKKKKKKKKNHWYSGKTFETGSKKNHKYADIATIFCSEKNNVTQLYNSSFSEI